MTECKQAIFLDLQKHTNEDGLPIMDRQTFEMVTNSIGKEKFREQIAEYIAKTGTPALGSILASAIG